ncbi:gp53-like domain-containing protein [uncultured Selenomonas sp.]|uniref:gp53-like domain-containing protein n=1 Tax=uncultured Selenomonas sp. TaxID=159275 RepID=UPI0028D2BB53|nr:phage tail protein [uncultured Selenomonas sp.]
MAEKTGQFSQSVVTQLGKGMIVESQNGKILVFTRVALGDGLIEDGEDIEKLTSIKKERLSCPIRSFVDKGNGQFALQFEVSNAALEKGFWHREIGVMAKIGADAEQLYAYSYAGTAASFLYDKTTPIQERIVKIDVVVGNTENLTVVIDSSIIHPTMAEVDARLTEHNESPNAHQDIREAITAHCTAAEIDHPEKSVHKKHLHQDAYESPALTGTPTAPTAVAGTNNTQIASTAFVAQAIAALVNSSPSALDTLQELAAALGNDANFAVTITNALASKVSKSGDTMTGDLTVSTLVVQDGYFGNYQRDTGDAIANNGGANVNIASWWGIGFYSTQTKRYTGAMNLRTGDWRTLGTISAEGGFEGTLRGKADSAGNSDNLGGQSLQWILNQIGAAKTGIIAGNLAQNGWVKFANGLIVQWGTVPPTQKNSVAFPIAFPAACFSVHCNNASESLYTNTYKHTVVTFKISKTGFSYAFDDASAPVQWMAIGY